MSSPQQLDGAITTEGRTCGKQTKPRRGLSTGWLLVRDHWLLVFVPPHAFMFLSVWMTRQLAASDPILSSRVNKKCRASVMRRRYDSIVAKSRRLSSTESFALPCLCECASRIPSRVFQSVVDPRRWSFQQGVKVRRVFRFRDGARPPDEIASVTQGSGNMVALMPRIFFAVASVGIAVLITALILTALRL